MNQALSPTVGAGSLASALIYDLLAAPTLTQPGPVYGRRNGSTAGSSKGRNETVAAISCRRARTPAGSGPFSAAATLASTSATDRAPISVIDTSGFEITKRS